MILNRDECGFLEKAITLHPFAPKDRVEILSPRHSVHEIASGRLASYRPLAWVCFAFAIMRTVRYARELVRTQSLDFVRAHDPYFAGLVGYLATRWPRVPFCISIHADYDSQHLLSPGTASPLLLGSRRLAKVLEHFLLRRADLVLPISRHTAMAAERSGARPDRIRIFRHLIDTASYAEADQQRDETRSYNIPIISVVSRLSREKHILDLVEFAAKLKREGWIFQLVIAGDGPERQELELRLAKQHVRDVVSLLGAVRPEEVKSLRLRSTLCVCLLDGLSLIEALAAGKPIVGYDIEWHREAILDGVNGYLVREGDLDALVKSAATILSDFEMARRMGAQSRKMATAFDRQSGVQEHRAIYRELIGIRER